MPDFISSLFDTAGFPARWNCGSGWSTELGVVHIASDIGTFLAYVSIPLLLGVFCLRRRDFPFPRVAWLFAAFILSCGVGHLIEAIIFYYPVYRLAGLTKLITATVSILTVVAMIRVVPQALALRSPAQFEEELARRMSEIEGLKRETMRLQTLVESSPEGVALIRKDGRIRFTNRAARKLLGSSPTADTSRLGGPWTQALERAKAEETRVIVESEGAKVSLTAFPVAPETSDASEEEVALLLADETETHNLNRRLILQARDLQAAGADLDAYAFTISHDLRAPLRQIAGFTDQIQRHGAEQLDSRARENLTCIQEAVGRLQHLTTALLRFARGGRAKLSTGPIDLHQLTRDVRRELDRDTPGAVEWVQGPLPMVTADGVLLRQVMRNLLENALKFTASVAAPRVEIRAERSAGQTTITISDNGVGFPAESAGEVFQVFQRLSHEDSYEGTGVGLAIVKRIVIRHGGQVFASGQVGQGATFGFTLPDETRSEPSE